MKKQWIIACLIGIQGVNVQAQQPSKYPYQDTKLTAEQRADDLLQRLTLEEKVALMQNNSPAIPRLGIKPYEWWNEALHGVARAGLATVFPQAIGMAASFNDELLYEVFDAVSDEARAKNRQFNEKGQYKRYQGLTMWTPNVNIFRDPRWGRGQETYGEDPYLSGRMGMAAVRGLQGPEDAEYDKLHACAKHFAVHSGPEWNRHSFNAENIAPRDLWETYLPAFKELVQKAGVKEVMCAYNRFEGDPCCGSNRLLTQILRNDWGFKGIVVTDCGAIGDFFQRKKHETHPDAAHASADAVLSGTDLECGGNFKSITDAVKKGLISEEKINTSVKRLLKARFELGEMNSTHPWSNIPFSVIDCPKHKELALKMAHESLVLLQNNNNILPLNRQMKVAVIGPNANDSVMQWGNYNGFPSHTVTLLEGIRAKLPDAQIIYEPVCGYTNDTTLHSLFNQCSIDGEAGFNATYWNNREYKGKIAATDRLTTPFHFSAEGSTVFAPGVGLKNFTAIYRSTFRPTDSGAATFRVMTNGGVTLFLNGKQIAEATNIKNHTNLYSFNYEAGKSYDIQLHFIQVKDNPTLHFDLAKQTPMDARDILNKLKNADVVIFAVPDTLIKKLSAEYVPMLKPGTVFLILDPAAAVAKELTLRDDCTFGVAHPCHPSYFKWQKEEEAYQDRFGGEGGHQDIVMSCIQGDEEKFKLAQETARCMYRADKAFVMTSEQIAFLEPTLVETLGATCCYAMAETVNEAVKRGIDREAAVSFLTGHVFNLTANFLGYLPGNPPVSDACKVALEIGNHLVLRDDWKKIWDDELLRKVIATMLHPETSQENLGFDVKPQK